MVSRSIVQAMKSNTVLANLVGSSGGIFAEHGQGDKTVVVSDNNKDRPVQAIEPLKSSRIQILVSGWDVEAGESIAYCALNVLEKLTGATLTIAGVATYTIKSIAVISEPVLISWGNSKQFSCNTRITYIEQSLL